jgi:hypothetical protein
MLKRLKKVSVNFRNRGTAGVELVEPPLSAKSSLLQISSQLEKNQHDRKKQGDALWLPQVEVVTYTGPHRRLVFGSYVSK